MEGIWTYDSYASLHCEMPVVPWGAPTISQNKSGCTANNTHGIHIQPLSNDVYLSFRAWPAGSQASVEIIYIKIGNAC